MYDIDRTKKPKKISLFLAKPNKTIIGKLRDAMDINQGIKFGDVNDLTFTIPYYISINHKKELNPLVNQIRERFLVKVVLGDASEWYVIRKKTKSGNDTDTLKIECFSLGYELKYTKMIDYSVTSTSCLKVLLECLKGTNWKVGYVNTEFNLIYRSFDVSSSTKLDFLFQIADTFKGVVTFDTNNRLVNIWKEEELSVYKGFLISYGKYLQTIDEEIDMDEVCTRLHIRGNNGLTINKVNPTGQDYIDDFSYFLYPFERDENRNVIQSSYFMDDSLCHAIVDYNEKVDSLKDKFKKLLEEKKTQEGILTAENNKLDELNSDLTIILDNIEISKVNNEPNEDLIKQRDNKQAEITKQKNKVSVLESIISGIAHDITYLGKEIKIENNLTESQMEELIYFIYEDEWSDDNYIDENELYKAAIKQMSERNSPPINISIEIINFFEIVEEQYNWDRLGIGDIIKIKHDRLGVYVQAKIIGINFDYEAGTIKLTISNLKRINSNMNWINKLMYTIQKNDKDYTKRKVEWNKIATNFNIRNDRISAKPSNPIFKNLTHVENDNGSVNLTISWDYSDYKITNNDSDNIDGFIVYLYSNDKNETYIFGSKMVNETKISMNFSESKYTFPSLPSNKYYTLGVQAYRMVDEDINSEGILLSDIISSNTPYLPSSTININGRVNGVRQIVGPVPPLNPEKNDKWTDTSGTSPVEKVYNGEIWVETAVGNVDKLNGYSASTEDVSNTVVVRDSTGIINGSISGDANTVGGKNPSDFISINAAGIENGVATLDSTGNVPSIQLNNVKNFASGNYVGNGTISRFVNTGFAPTLVKIYTTNATDNSLFIPSLTGGFLFAINTTAFYLNGISPSPVNGKLNVNGFETGNSIDVLGNKLNTTYYWEAYK